MQLPRMTIRRWMIVVAVGTVCSLACRSLALAALAAYHESKSHYSIALSNRGCLYLDRDGNIMAPAGFKGCLEQRNLSKMYRKAAAWPWLPVEPDLPEPEP